MFPIKWILIFISFQLYKTNITAQESHSTDKYEIILNHLKKTEIKKETIKPFLSRKQYRRIKGKKDFNFHINRELCDIYQLTSYHKSLEQNPLIKDSILYNDITHYRKRKSHLEERYINKKIIETYSSKATEYKLFFSTMGENVICAFLIKDMPLNTHISEALTCRVLHFSYVFLDDNSFEFDSAIWIPFVPC